MFKDMLAAGVTRHGWLLLPIVADLAERDERLQRQQKRLTYWLKRARPVLDALVAERVELKQLTEQRERQRISYEEPTVRKRRLQEMHERSAEKCTLQEWTTDEEEGEGGGGALEANEE